MLLIKHKGDLGVDPVFGNFVVLDLRFHILNINGADVTYRLSSLVNGRCAASSQLFSDSVITSITFSVVMLRPLWLAL
jgi:hypothetical protein